MFLKAFDTIVYTFYRECFWFEQKTTSRLQITRQQSCSVNWTVISRLRKSRRQKSMLDVLIGLIKNRLTTSGTYSRRQTNSTTQPQPELVRKNICNEYHKPQVVQHVSWEINDKMINDGWRGWNSWQTRWYVNKPMWKLLIITWMYRLSHAVYEDFVAHPIAIFVQQCAVGVCPEICTHTHVHTHLIILEQGG